MLRRSTPIKPLNVDTTSEKSKNGAFSPILTKTNLPLPMVDENHIVDGKAFIFRTAYFNPELYRAESFAQLVFFIKSTDKPESLRFHVENGHFIEWLGNHIETIGPADCNGNGSSAMPAEKLAARFAYAKEHFNEFEWVNVEQVRSWALDILEKHLKPDEKIEVASLVHLHANSKNGKRNPAQDDENKKHYMIEGDTSIMYLG